MKKLPVVGAALLLAALLSPAYAEDSDIKQTRTQDRLHRDVDLQTPTADFAQDRDRDRLREHAENESQNQYRNKYKYTSQFQTRQGGSSISRDFTQRHSMAGSRR